MFFNASHVLYMYYTCISVTELHYEGLVCKFGVLPVETPNTVQLASAQATG